MKYEISRLYILRLEHGTAKIIVKLNSPRKFQRIRIACVHVLYGEGNFNHTKESQCTQYNIINTPPTCCIHLLNSTEEVIIIPEVRRTLNGKRGSTVIHDCT